MRTRFTLRRAMVFVVLVALGCVGARWAGKMRDRSRSYQEWADLYDIKRQYATVRSLPGWDNAEEREAARAAVEWYSKRRDLYNAAAARPWLDVPPAAEPRLDVPPAPKPRPVAPPAPGPRFD